MDVDDLPKGDNMKEAKKRMPVSRILRKEMQLHLMILPAIILVLTHIKYTQKVHPVIWIALSAIAGAIFKL